MVCAEIKWEIPFSRFILHKILRMYISTLADLRMPPSTPVSVPVVKIVEKSGFHRGESIPGSIYK